MMDQNTIGAVLGVAFTLATAGLALGMNLRGVRPKLTHPWAKPATLRIVDTGKGAGTADQVALVEACWTRWKRHGAPCGEILRGLSHTVTGAEFRVTGSGPYADDPLPDEGHIIVCFGTSPDFEPEHLGRTYLSADLHGEPIVSRWAICRIGTPTKLVILHELGHAFGFRGHVSKRGHILNAGGALGDSFDGCAQAFEKGKK